MEGYSQPRMLRTEIATTGSFVAVPSAFPTAESAIQNAIKLEFETVYSAENLAETVFSTDKVLIDFAAVDAEALDPETVAVDCDLLKQAARSHPEALKKMIAALQRGGSEGATEADRIAVEIGLTEEEAQKRGGGFFWIVVVIGGALGGCATGGANKILKAKTTPSK
jgi:hypothetical protein